MRNSRRLFMFPLLVATLAFAQEAVTELQPDPPPPAEDATDRAAVAAARRKALWEQRIGGDMFAHELLIPKGCEELIPLLQTHFLEVQGLRSEAASRQLDSLALEDAAKIETLVANAGMVREHLLEMIADDDGKGTIPLALKTETLVATELLVKKLDIGSARTMSPEATPAPAKKQSAVRKRSTTASATASPSVPAMPPKKNFFSELFGRNRGTGRTTSAPRPSNPRGN